MAEVARGAHSHKYSALHILDARFPYEYDGGHIAGAVNIHTNQMLEKYMEERVVRDPSDPRPICIIIHCEFSQMRGPALYV